MPDFKRAIYKEKIIFTLVRKVHFEVLEGLVPGQGGVRNVGNYHLFLIRVVGVRGAHEGLVVVEGLEGLVLGVRSGVRALLLVDGGIFLAELVHVNYNYLI